MASFEDMEDDQMRKEFLQKRHYKLLGELQSMCRELPVMYQQRLPNELLSSLANSLLDKTVFEIVKGLTDIQSMTERNLLEKRMKIVNTQIATRENLMKNHREALAAESDVAYIQQKKERLEKEMTELFKWQEEELNRFDMKIILELDQTVNDQQVTLEKVGVPGFFVSSKDTDIRLQMYVLNFIKTLSAKDGIE